jgi:hypothetical protein
LGEVGHAQRDGIVFGENPLIVNGVMQFVRNFEIQDLLHLLSRPG